MFKLVHSFLKDESGATAIEYGLIAALVALAGVAAFTALGGSVTEAFNNSAEELCTGAGGTWTAATASAGASCS